MQRAQMVAVTCSQLRMNHAAISAHLMAAGLTEVDAEVGIEVVASAFGWAILRRMGVSDFDDLFTLRSPDGHEHELPVAGSHLFTCALIVATGVFELGYTATLDREGVGAIVEYSAEASAVSRALAEEPSMDVSGASLKTSFDGFGVDDFLHSAGYAPETP